MFCKMKPKSTYYHWVRKWNCVAKAILRFKVKIKKNEKKTWKEEWNKSRSGKNHAFNVWNWHFEPASDEIECEPHKYETT